MRRQLQRFVGPVKKARAVVGASLKVNALTENGNEGSKEQWYVAQCTLLVGSQPTTLPSGLIRSSCAGSLCRGSLAPIVPVEYTHWLKYSFTIRVNT